MKLVAGIKHSIEKHPAWYVFFTLCALIFFVYGFSVLKLGFVSDDYEMLWVTRHHTGSVFSYFLTNLIGVRGGHSYGPIYNLFFSTEYALFGMQAWGYHLVSLLLHALTSFFIYLFSARLLKKKGRAFMISILFALWHTHVSSLAWISVQPHLIATCAYIGGLWAFLYFLDTQKKWMYVISMIAFAAGIFAKEIAMTFPLMMLLLLYIRRNQWAWTYLIRKSVLLLLLPAVVFVSYFLLRQYTTSAGLGFYANTGLHIDFVRMWQMFLELSTNMVVAAPYRHMIVLWLLAHTVVMSVSIVVVFLLPYIVLKKKSLSTYLSMLCYAIVTVPVLQLGYNTLTNEGERYTYLPSFFFLLTLVLFFTKIIRVYKKQCIARVFGMFLFVCALTWSVFISTQKIQDWTDADSIVRSVVSSYSDVSLAPNTYVYLLGLPDTLNGAQLFRNASFYMFALETGDSLLKGDRISMYHQITADSFSDTTLSFEFDNSASSTWMLQDQDIFFDRPFIGLPVVNHDYADFMITDFRKSDESGTSIVVSRSEEQRRAADTDDVEVAILTYTHGTLKPFYLNIATSTP